MTRKTAPIWRASSAKPSTADRYPLSPRVRRLKELLAKIDPAPNLAPEERSAVLAKKQRR